MANIWPGFEYLYEEQITKDRDKWKSLEGLHGEFPLKLRSYRPSKQAAAKALAQYTGKDPEEASILTNKYLVYPGFAPSGHPITHTIYRRVWTSDKTDDFGFDSKAESAGGGGYMIPTLHLIAYAKGAVEVNNHVLQGSLLLRFHDIYVYPQHLLAVLVGLRRLGEDSLIVRENKQGDAVLFRGGKYNGIVTEALTTENTVYTTIC